MINMLLKQVTKSMAAMGMKTKQKMVKMKMTSTTTLKSHITKSPMKWHRKKQQ
jgi:hypothetical protein